MCSVSIHASILLLNFKSFQAKHDSSELGLCVKDVHLDVQNTGKWGLAHKWRKVTWTDESSVAQADGHTREKKRQIK